MARYRLYIERSTVKYRLYVAKKKAKYRLYIEKIRQSTDFISRKYGKVQILD